ncbi:BA14K family protein [Neorhizobium sp. T6_25]|uniref:BA14K family protein n=1 Tax=Neorhizobium sp. T6_25 TaxID=2093833 RepID=UPI00352B40C0
MAAEHLDWCATRYRSYRPRDNSYTPFSGGRRQCESPYSILPSGSGAEPDVEEISEAPNGDDSFEDASIAVPARQQEVADLGRSSVRGDEHAQSCFARYRSYRIEDNSYQPVSGGPRRQCQ